MSTQTQASAPSRSCFALGAAALALLAPDTRQAKPADPVVEEQPVLDLAA